MNKEQIIEEMAKDIFESSPIPELWRSHAERIAEYLIDKGYRKESEIAKEIFDKIAKHLMKLNAFSNIEYVAIETAALIKISDEYKEK